MRQLAPALLATALALTSTAAHATKIPLGPTPESGFLNVNLQLQTWVTATQHGAADRESTLYDMRLRRARIQILADPTDKWSFLLQTDSPNWGAGGNYTPSFIIQDFWGSYAFTGRTGGTAVMVDAGMLLIPVSRQGLHSTTSFTTVDGHFDAVKGFRDSPGLRDLGIQLRGWALNKRIGFRGGVYRGTVGTSGAFDAATNPRAGLNPHSQPRYGGFVNFNVLGSEEGAWLYNGIYFTEKPVVSVGGAGVYQSRSSRTPGGLITDARLFSGHVFADIPTLPNSEATFHATVYRNDFGFQSPNSGLGWFADLGYRWTFFYPYVSYERFTADDPSPTGAATDSELWKGGLSFFINKNANHIKLELSRGTSPSINAGRWTTQFIGQWNFVF